MPTTPFLVQWFVTWVILAVVFYGAAEAIQRYLYETPVDRLAWRVMAVTPLLAAVLVKWPLPFDALFFNLTVTFAQASLWFLACWLAMRFQWQHAAAAGLIAVVTIAPVASSSVQSLIVKRFSTSAPTPARGAKEKGAAADAAHFWGVLQTEAAGDAILPGFGTKGCSAIHCATLGLFLCLRLGRVHDLYAVARLRHGPKPD